jgi:predicted metalloprotease with PDZ domain
MMTRVVRGTPAFDAGIDVDDEIVAINDVRLPAGQLAARIAQFRPGETATFTISRRDLLRRLDVTFGTAPTQSWSLVVRPNATADQAAHLTAWLQ